MSDPFAGISGQDNGTRVHTFTIRQDGMVQLEWTDPEDSGNGVYVVKMAVAPMQAFPNLPAIMDDLREAVEEMLAYKRNPPESFRAY